MSGARERQRKRYPRHFRGIPRVCFAPTGYPTGPSRTHEPCQCIADQLMRIGIPAGLRFDQLVQALDTLIHGVRHEACFTVYCQKR